VLDLARQLDIATNPHPSAIFEAGNGGFQVWRTPQGRNGISMIPGAFSKPCEYVGRSGQYRCLLWYRLAQCRDPALFYLYVYG
jgi:hypothetical protein